MICRVCSNIPVPFAEALILGKYQAQYFSCKQCGFIQTEDPYWLEEAYSSAITRSDIGLASRNITFAAIGKAVIRSYFDANARFLDYGGGYGLLVRLMRDAGFDFYRYDKLCVNLFAEGADVDEQNPGAIELITAVEVFEHLVQPVDTVAHMLHFSKNILFTTELVPPDRPHPGEWPYYGLEHGQHVGLYTARTLAVIADRFHLNFYSNGTSLHLFTEKKISAFRFNWLAHYRVARLIEIFPARKSLLAQDHVRVVQKHRD
jgi:hypothetical protein